jgi:hypothetical protein
MKTTTTTLSEPTGTLPTDCYCDIMTSKQECLDVGYCKMKEDIEENERVRLFKR